MPKARVRRYQQSELDSLFQRADKQWEAGNLRSAFRLFLAAAKAGDSGCQSNLGYFYDVGIGVKRNRTLALDWYRRAYRGGMGSAASNIGTVYRDERNLKEALKWFERAVKLENGDANLEIAKIYLNGMNDRKKAVHYLKQALKCKRFDLTEGSREEAQRLLSRLHR